MSLTFKLLSLVIRTAAKPLGNTIKRQAKEHPGFRRFAVSSAQWVHRVDMRMRLGILHDNAAQERMAERERKKEEEKRKAAEVPIVRTEAEQIKYLEELAKETEAGGKKDETPKIKIRPLSETKAIELGANFFSEAFIFGVAVGLLVWDSWRSRSKESGRRDEVKERLDGLEMEIGRLRTILEPGLQPLPERSEKEQSKAWYNPAGWWERVLPEKAQVEDEEMGNIAAASATTKRAESVTTKVNAVQAEPAKDNGKVSPAEHAKESAAQEIRAAAQPPPPRLDSVQAGSKVR